MALFAAKFFARTLVNFLARLEPGEAACTPVF